jgi:hypothetical protein
MQPFATATDGLAIGHGLIIAEFRQNMPNPERASGKLLPVGDRDVDPAATEAARALNRARWGTQAIDRMINELFERSNELTPEHLSELRRLIRSY